MAALPLRNSCQQIYTKAEDKRSKTLADLIPQPIKLRMMQPKERLIGREADPHVLAILLGQGLGAISCQVAPDEVVYVVMHQCHCVLELEEVARGLLGRIAHKLRAEGAVLRPFMRVPTSYERQVPPQPVRDGPGEFKIAGGWGKSASGHYAVGLGGGIAVSCPAEPVLGRVPEDWRVKQIGVIARPVPVWCWPAIPAALAEGDVEQVEKPTICGNISMCPAKE